MLYDCQICRRCFLTPEELQAHSVSHHKKSQKKQAPTEPKYTTNAPLDTFEGERALSSAGSCNCSHQTAEADPIGSNSTRKTTNDTPISHFNCCLKSTEAEALDSYSAGKSSTNQKEELCRAHNACPSQSIKTDKFLSSTEEKLGQIEFPTLDSWYPLEPLLVENPFSSLFTDDLMEPFEGASIFSDQLDAELNFMTEESNLLTY